MSVISDGIKNVVAANVARTVQRGFKKVVGNLNINRAQSLSNLSSGLMTKTKYTTENLAYPLNVEGDPQQGHHIIFEIMEQQKGKIEANKIEKRRKATLTQVGDQKGFSTMSPRGPWGYIDGIPAPDQIVGFPEVASKNMSKSAKGGKKMRSLSMKKLPTKKMSVAIALYMPPSLKVQYAADYGEEEIGIVAETGGAVIEAFMTGTASKQTALDMLGAGETLVKGMATAALDAVAPGAKAVMALREGKVITPRMELMFKGIGRREFSFEFSFIPKSEQEAIVVEQIIHKFKFHMASNFHTGAEGVRKMDIPDHFNIRYMYSGGENTHLNKISTCVLKSLDVEYGGDRFVAYSEGRPQQTKISLTFQELEIITKDDIAQGY